MVGPDGLTDEAGGLEAKSRPAGFILAARGLFKRYPGVVALDGVDFEIQEGEVRAVVGKNGAGKSTLIKILCGAVQPDDGQIRIEGRVVRLASPMIAQTLGIAPVYQDFSLVPELSVAENIMIGRWGRRGLVDHRLIAREAKAALQQLGVDLDLNAKVGQLRVADQQAVEIAKALTRNPRVLILDEPTSSLAAPEIGVLIGLVRRLATQGVAVIWVSHRLQEIPQVADQVTVFRDGRAVATLAARDTPLYDIAEMMAGASWGKAEPSAPKPDVRMGGVLLSVQHLSWRDRVNDISLVVREGEVVGLAGALGSGRTELLRCIYGLETSDRGTVRVDGVVLRRRNPRSLIRRGVALSPDDRVKLGLIPGSSIADNLVLASLKRVSRKGIISSRRRDELAAYAQRRLSIKASSLRIPVETLSGGNQQKVVVGRLINAGARVLLLDEPTKGVDVHAKEQFYQLIRELAAEGIGVVLAPSELDELFSVCDRILVLSRGRVVAERRPADTSLTELVMLTTREG